MRRGNYLNVILTINAVLLAALVWTQVTDSPVLSNTAHAQSDYKAVRNVIPNAAVQRRQMIDALNDTKRNMEAMKRMLESGRVKVTIANIDELRDESSE